MKEPLQQAGINRHRCVGLEIKQCQDQCQERYRNCFPVLACNACHPNLFLEMGYHLRTALSPENNREKYLILQHMSVSAIVQYEYTSEYSGNRSNKVIHNILENQPDCARIHSVQTAAIYSTVFHSVVQKCVKIQIKLSFPLRNLDEYELK